MTDLRALLAPIRERLAAATPGPWRYDGNSCVETVAEFDLHRFDLMGETVAKVHLEDADGEFIANAPTDLARLLAGVEDVVALHKPVKIYDECDCPPDTHPEDYDYIDCSDYVGCDNSLTGIGCEECCVDAWDSLTQDCGENHTHVLDPNKRCHTVTALAAALGSDTTNQEGTQ